MVAVKMRRDEVVNFCQPGHFRRRLENAPGIARARIACVNQDGFAGGRHDQRRAAAFHVVPINVERVVGQSGIGARQNHPDREQQCKTAEKVFHKHELGCARNDN